MRHLRRHQTLARLVRQVNEFVRSRWVAAKLSVLPDEPARGRKKTPSLTLAAQPDELAGAIAPNVGDVMAGTEVRPVG